VDEDIKGSLVTDVQQTLLRCFMSLADWNGGSLAKNGETQLTGSAGSRGKSQTQMPVVIPEEAEDVL
jgi:hypothetical protein